MIAAISPNKAMLFAGLAFVAYWIIALVVPGPILRDVFNALAFGAAVIITITWAPSAYKALRENADSGEWQLILAIFLVWFIILMNRFYAAIYNYYGQPHSWTDGPVSGFFPYSFMVAGGLFLSAPGVQGDKIQSSAIMAIIAAVAIGSLAAGIVLGYSISTAG